MTRINSAIPVNRLTDEHLLAEHREIKRLPFCFKKAWECKTINNIPKKFCLGTGHIKFFLDKAAFTLFRYKQIYNECLKRGFNVINYSDNWNKILFEEYWNNYLPTDNERSLLIERISQRINDSNKKSFHYRGKCITKKKAIEILEGENC